MSHIHTGPGQHDATASAVIMRIDGAAPRVLMHIHKKLGKLLQPGGHVELDETPWQTITHELLEETGYDLDQLQVLQPPMPAFTTDDPIMTTHPLPFLLNTHQFIGLDHYHTDTAFAFVTGEDPRHPIAEGESDTLRWLTEEEIVALSADDIIGNARDIVLYALRVVLKEWRPVNNG